MFRSTSIISCTVLALSFCSAGRAQQATSKQASHGIAHPRNPNQQPAADMPMSMPLVAPFFVENDGYQSSITMVNELTKGIHGTVIARAGDGSELGRKLVMLPAHSRMVLAVSELLGGSEARQITGSLELIPDPMEAEGMPIAAQLSIVGNRTMPPTHLEEEFLSVDPHVPSQYRAVVPPTVSSPTVALFSTSASQQHVAIKCLAEDGSVTRRSVDLGAWQMSAIPACNGREAFDSARSGFETVFEATRDKPTAVGIDVSTDASPGSLAVWGVSGIGREHNAKIALNFTNVSTLRSKETIFAGVPGRNSRSSARRYLQTGSGCSKLW